VNLYAFVGNDGLNQWDLLGLENQCCCQDNSKVCKAPTFEELKSCIKVYAKVFKRYYYFNKGYKTREYEEHNNPGKLPSWEANANYSSSLIYEWVQTKECECVQANAAKFETIMTVVIQYTRKNETTYESASSHFKAPGEFRVLLYDNIQRWTASGSLGMGFQYASFQQVWLSHSQKSVKAITKQNGKTMFTNVYTFEEGVNIPKK
jgi:hypothetical protein